MIDPKMRNLHRVITQNTPKCVENCSGDRLS